MFGRLVEYVNAAEVGRKLVEGTSGALHVLDKTAPASPQGQQPGMTLTISGSSQRFGSPTPITTDRVAILVTTLAFVEFGNSGVVAALDTSLAIPANVWVELGIVAGSYVAIIGTSGTAYLRELGEPA